MIDNGRLIDFVIEMTKDGVSSSTIKKLVDRFIRDFEKLDAGVSTVKPMSPKLNESAWNTFTTTSIDTDAAMFGDSRSQHKMKRFNFSMGGESFSISEVDGNYCATAANYGNYKGYGSTIELAIMSLKYRKNGINNVMYGTGYVPNIFTAKIIKGE